MTILDIQQAVAMRFRLRVADLRGTRRPPSISGPRAIGMYLARVLLGMSFPQIGMRFGGKDHSTVIHACKRVRAADLPDHQLRELHGLHAALTAGLTVRPAGPTVWKAG